MFEHFSRVFLLVLSYIVLTSLAYILPAIAVAVIVWDRSIYFSCVTHPAYGIFIGLTAIIGMAIYIGDLCDREII
jgi:hypothetical protein